MHSSIAGSDGIVLQWHKKTPSVSSHSDLNFADDITLVEVSIAVAQDLLLRVTTACQSVSLFLNAKKTKFMMVNSNDTTPLRSSDRSDIEKVDNFKYLGGFTKTASDLNTHQGQA